MLVGYRVERWVGARKLAALAQPLGRYLVVDHGNERPEFTVVATLDALAVSRG
ncbi:hypothetical protein AB0F91_44640 [Amycolatopsis sp. NPDC023774]|uniref:hypothetical protein n=1 Tax=Amycolatopsis sp. NPDC023774 TaxID=3155015 RepID=UPI0033DA6158